MFTLATIRMWRYNRGLPPNIKPLSKKTNNQSVHMETVLSPEQCSLVRQFFKYLLVAKKLNPNFDIGYFMNEYRKVM